MEKEAQTPDPIAVSGVVGFLALRELGEESLDEKAFD